ncbi:DNA primase regulatory subunit PriL [Methanocella sp. CWC-04]|uniref:DNA primase large subunit PriL n=1 Tax=Methanooceanicella nereidis TaxID=2052831 RepID=A0AAP2W5W7_9EURY|nr:DNA primase regulatory subunit PriL [Methanocella sp. CWC-04]MCD1293729.1 DNA primase regulatory subunit PriL [Methanocella sp. CWC-04]
MDVITFAKYPFLQESSLYVKEKGYSMDSIVNGRAFERVRARGKMRVLSAISGESPKTEELPEPEIELLTYPVSKMIISVIGDQYLSKRYALWESKRAHDFLMTENDETIVAVGREFGINTRMDGRYFILHFTDYLRYSATIKDMKWKLINKKMISGMVYVEKSVYARLLEEAVRERIYSTLFVDPPKGLDVALAPYVSEVKAALDKLKSEKSMVTDGEVSQGEFPPCMKYLLSELQKGVNLPHTARFALTSFLANIGLNKDEIMDLYRMAPDFREDLTRYQVEHITGSAGTEYTAPSCKTMMTYGNCYGKNRMCEWVTHPLSYYRKAIMRKKKNLEGLKPSDKKDMPVEVSSTDGGERKKENNE